jgi:hypothetical protein
MRFLMLLAVLAGCKSAPVQYEMIEVNGEKLSNMRRSVQRKGKAIVLEMHDRNAGKQRPGRGLLGPCRAIPRATGPLLATSRIDARGSATAERRTTAGNQTADACIRLSTGD